MFGARLRWFREAAGLTQEELAERAQLTRNFSPFIASPSFLAAILENVLGLPSHRPELLHA